MKIKVLLYSVCVFIAICSGCRNNSSQSGRDVISLADLRCEYLVDPLGIDVEKPRLSWLIESNLRGERQTAYQVLVASTPELLARDQGDIWNSGKVNSDQSIHVEYAGKPLTSRTRCYWKVRVWDRFEEESAWSKPAMWSMGLLNPEEWNNAQWIGLEISKKAKRQDEYFLFELPEGKTHTINRIVMHNFGGTDNSYYSRDYSVQVSQFADPLGFKKVNSGTLKAETGPQTFKFAQVAARYVKLVIHSGYRKDGVVALGEFEVYTPHGKNLISAKEGGKLKAFSSQHMQSGDWSAERINDDVVTGGSGSWCSESVNMEASGQLPARYLRRDFTLEKPVKQAMVYLCGLGEFELYMNGRKVGDHERDPGVSEFERRVFYITFDVDEYLSSGQNAVGIILGNGRYVVPAHRHAALGYPKLIFHMRIEYVDGTTQDLNSDDQWNITANGPIRGNDEYHGEHYDARKEMPGWNQTGFDASRWKQAQLLTPPGGELQARMYEPLRVTETFQPEKITNPDSGVYIVKFEKGFYGTVRLKVSGPAGTKVTMRSTFSLYPNGRLNLRNQVGGKTTDSYILKGQGTEVWRPHFRGQGTRYVEVSGFPGTPTLENFEGLFMHDDVEETGLFECSNDQLNKLHRMIRFDQLGQKHSHPMELERIERQGWLGGSGTYSEAESAHLNVAAFYSKWLGDIRLDQRSDGALCDVSPRQGWGKYSGSVTWPADIVLIPQVLYKYYGDRRVLKENYDVMKKWVLNIQGRQNKSTLIVEGDDRYGDWVDVATIGISQKEWPKGRLTSIPLINTAYLYNHFKQLATIAHTLGKPGDQARFEDCASRTEKAFNQEFFDPQTNKYESESQCSYVLPLAFGLVPPDRREAVISNLVHDIMVTHDQHVSVGLIGMAWMMRTLNDIGRDDVAYALATQVTRPSWGYMLAKDASGMWEYWDGDDRSNGTTGFSSGQGFLMLAGDLGAWIYQSLAGINPDPQQPGFKHIILKPQPVGDLTYVNCSYKSIHGRIVSNWKRDKGNFKWDVTIPANTTATVYVPTNRMAEVMEGGQPADEAEGLVFLRMEEGRAVFEACSGNYEFISIIN